MTAVVVRHAWLQKHPTPTASTGEFHWHPATALGGDGPTLLDELGDLRLALVDRLRGVVPPAALWQLAPGRVVWAQVFAATAPGDGRRYCGLAVTLVEHPGATAADLLASVTVPPAAPWSGEAAEREVALVPAVAAPLTATRRAHRDAVLAAPASVVRALISGGIGAVEDPARPDLPAWIASLEAWLPAAMTARPRRGEWRGGAPRITDAADRVADVLLAAWCPPDGVAAARTRRAWTILNQLATSQGRSLDDVAALVLDPADRPLDRALTRDELAHFPAADATAIAPWVHALHHWGRGRLDGSPAAATLVERLADLVISTALADHVAGRDERAAVAGARWHALLPPARRRELLDAVAARAPALAELFELEPRRRVATGRRPEVTRA